MLAGRPYEPDDEDQELREVLARLPQRTPAELPAELQAARHASAEAWIEPTIGPMPQFPTWGVVRYPCPLGCGWHHDEQPGAEAFGPILLPLDDPAQLDAALTARASERAELYHARVEAAVADHWAQAHPDAG
ncbi:hypothetical protein ABZ733_23575 [Streptomyces longwoodensis]|uniref:hypothetical protein n=1 Tax=Streptomyces longwoodensis TaxID=68231 RepID=UPI0033D3316A